jgi:hypothetical protein
MQAARTASLILVAAGAITVGCVHGPSTADDAWRRVFFAPADAVWAAALDSLADLDFEIDRADREDGVIRAERTRGGPARAVIIGLRMTVGNEWVRVDIEGGSPASNGPPDMERLTIVAHDVLGAISDRLESARN